MKKSIVISVLLLIVFSFATVANAGTTLTLDKAAFLPGPNQTVKVYFTTDYPLFDSAWIGVIPEGVPHGSEEDGDDHDVSYQYVEDAKYDSSSRKYVELEVPFTAGNYEVRIYSSDDTEEGIELAYTPLIVGTSASTTTPTTTTTPVTTTPGTDNPGSNTSGTTLTLDKAAFLPGPNQTVKVYFTTNYPLFDSAWIGVIPEGVPHGSEEDGDDHDVSYQYVGDAKYDSSSRKYVELEVPFTAGNYQVRMYSSDEAEEGIELAYTPLTVGASTATTTPTTTPGTTTPGTTVSGTTTPGTSTPGATAPGTTSPGNTTPGVTNAPVTIINNNTTINQNTNTTTNNANTNTNISGSTIANSNIASNNQTNQTTTNDNSIKVTQYVSVKVNGQPLQSDVKPFVNGDGRTMLPIRAIAEALGATVQWDEATQTATLTLGAKIVKVTIGQNNILVDGNPVPMDTAAAVKDGRTLLPVRAVGEAMGANVGWDAATSTVQLDK